jgi:anti-sigma regulatory factor (Ser/Thr protein kinase)
MTGAIRETVTLAGRAERARVARAFVNGILGPGHPCGDVAALLVDELFVNSIRHSGSGAPGETVPVAVKTANEVISVKVTDLSGPGVSEPRPAGSDAEDGRGLQLVARLAARWGWQRRDPLCLARGGFIVVVQDIRGRFASEGEWEPWTHGRRLRHGPLGRRTTGRQRSRRHDRGRLLGQHPVDGRTVQAP